MRRTLRRTSRRTLRRPITLLLCAGALLMGGLACSDDDDGASDEGSSTTTAADDAAATTLAKGVDVELDGDDDLGGQTLNIDAVEENGEVSGEFAITENVHRVECADTATDGYVILGGEVTAGDDFEGLQALIIKEGDPDGVHLYANSAGAATCEELLESIPADLLADEASFVLVEDGSDIET